MLPVLQPQVSIKMEQVDPEESQEGGVTSNLDPAVMGWEYKEATPTGTSAPLDATGGPGEGPPPPTSAWDQVTSF